MRAARGFSLLELLITLAALSVVLTIAMPRLGPAIERHTVLADTRTLLRVVRLARQAAVTTGKRVTICPVDGAQRCTSDWSRRIAAFTDQDNDRQVGDNDRILYHWGQEHRSVLRWRGFGSGYLRFSQRGLAAENGSFTLCPPGGSETLARQLVVNRVGRAYISQDRDNDGIVEYGNNKEPSC